MPLAGEVNTHADIVYTDKPYSIVHALVRLVDKTA